MVAVAVAVVPEPAGSNVRLLLKCATAGGGTLARLLDLHLKTPTTNPMAAAAPMITAASVPPPTPFPGPVTTVLSPPPPASPPSPLLSFDAASAPLPRDVLSFVEVGVAFVAVCDVGGDLGGDGEADIEGEGDGEGEGGGGGEGDERVEVVMWVDVEE